MNVLFIFKLNRYFKSDSFRRRFPNDVEIFLLPETAYQVPYQAMVSNKSPKIKDHKYFGKEFEKVLLWLENHSDVFQPSNKIRKKRSGTELGFHQCYYNPVSCFR